MLSKFLKFGTWNEPRGRVIGGTRLHHKGPDLNRFFFEIPRIFHSHPARTELWFSGQVQDFSALPWIFLSQSISLIYKNPSSHLSLGSRPNSFRHSSNFPPLFPRLWAMLRASRSRLAIMRSRPSSSARCTVCVLNGMRMCGSASRHAPNSRSAMTEVLPLQGTGKLLKKFKKIEPVEF